MTTDAIRSRLIDLVSEEVDRTTEQLRDVTWDDYVSDVRRMLNFNMDHPEEDTDAILGDREVV